MSDRKPFLLRIDRTVLFGWSVGGGAEVAFNPNWAARFDYQFTDFDAEAVTYPGGKLELDPEAPEVVRDLESARPAADDDDRVVAGRERRAQPRHWVALRRRRAWAWASRAPRSGPSLMTAPRLPRRQGRSAWLRDNPR